MRPRLVRVGRLGDRRELLERVAVLEGRIASCERVLATVPPGGPQAVNLSEQIAADRAYLDGLREKVH